MKTNDQIIRFFSNHGLNDKDWLSASEFCRKLTFKGIRRAANPDFKCTFAQFIEWFDNGAGSGDIVKVGKMIGVVCENADNLIIISPYIDQDGNFKKNGTLAVQDFEMANDEEILFFNTQLSQNMYSFNVKRGAISRRYVPRPKDKAAFSYDGHDGFLLAWAVDKNELVSAYAIIDDFVYEGLKIPVRMAEFRPVGRNEIKGMDIILRKNGCALDRNTGKIIKTVPRAVDGETYWYITDKFTVSSDKERGKPVNKLRHDRGNYFIDYQEALDFLIRIMNLRMNKGDQSA